MRVLVTGVDDEGRSCVVEEASAPTRAFGATGIAVSTLAGTDASPPAPGPPGRSEHIDIIGQPGLARWSLVDFPPNATTPFHHTDSVDYDVVLDGRVELVLDDGAHPLGPGDGVVVNGVDHAWTTGDEGCRMSVVVIGTG